MKKYFSNFIIGCILMVGLVSCSSENPVDSITVEPEMTIEMKNFKHSLIEWVKAKNSAAGIQVNDYNPNDKIIKEANDLLESENVYIQENKSSTSENEGAIISQAMRVYIEKSNIRK